METHNKLTIGFAMLSEAGHYYGSFRLARNLRARGHRIIYIGLADFRELVNAQGFEFVSFAEDLLPEGYIRNFSASKPDKGPGIVKIWRKRRHDESIFTEYLRRIEDGRLDECLLSCEPDLLLCDTFMWYVAIRAQKLKIPTVNISPNLPLYLNSRIPPVVSKMKPGRTRLSSVWVLSSWIWLRIKFFFTKRLASILLGAYRFPTRMHHLMNVFIKIAKRSGYFCKENVTYRFGEMGPRLVLPEIVLCPKAFQFPGSPEDGRLYIGDFVDFERSEEPLAPGELDTDKPLVFCSLGTSASFYPHSERFFRAVVKASSVKKEWQFVLHVGEHRDINRFGAYGPNLFIRNKVPQLSLLSRAAVMVNHGGLNSIIECIHFGVPMVIIPGLRDQPGSAARAVHHNIALTAKMSNITPDTIISLAGRAMQDVNIRQGLEEMKQRIADEKGMELIIPFIESFPGSL